jgi:hypothetical protein
MDFRRLQGGKEMEATLTTAPMVVKGAAARYDTYPLTSLNAPSRIGL